MHHASRVVAVFSFYFLILFYFSWSHNYGCYIWYFLFASLLSDGFVVAVRLCAYTLRAGTMRMRIEMDQCSIRWLQALAPSKRQSVWRIVRLVPAQMNRFVVFCCFICSQQAATIICVTQRTMKMCFLSTSSDRVSVFGASARWYELARARALKRTHGQRGKCTTRQRHAKRNSCSCFLDILFWFTCTCVRKYYLF